MVSFRSLFRRTDEELAPSADAPPAITASILPLQHYPQLDLKEEQWQQCIRRYAHDGPGFVGFALHLHATIASQVPLVPEYLNDQGQWVRRDDPMAVAAIQAFQGRDMPQEELLYRLFWNQEAVGEYYILKENVHMHDGDAHGLYFDVLSAPEIRPAGENWLDTYPRDNMNRHGRGARDYPEQGARSRVPRADVVKIIESDMCFHHEPYSPFRRVIPDIERYVAIVNNMRRTVDSRMTTNGILWAPSEAVMQYSQQVGTNGKPRNLHSDYTMIAKRGFEDGDSLEANVPFFLTSPGAMGAPQWIPVGRDLDDQLVAAAHSAMEDVARGIDIPMRVMTTGVGDSNHWSDWLLEDNYIKTVTKPKTRRGYNKLTMTVFRPLLEKLAIGEVHRWRVGGDFSKVTKKPDEGPIILDAYFRTGIPTRKAVADRLGLAEDEVATLGSDEYNFWAANVARAKNGRPEGFGGAEGAESNQLAIAPFDGFAPALAASAAKLHQIDGAMPFADEVSGWLADVDLDIS